MNNANIGMIIRHSRIKQHLSMRQLGELTGLSAATICRIENNKLKYGGNITMIKEILKVLNIQETDIFNKKESPRLLVVNPSALIPSLENAITVTTGDDDYSSGMRNGLKYALYLITGETPY